MSKSHVMGLTTDIETANKTKQSKVVVDTSQPDLNTTEESDRPWCIDKTGFDR